VHNASGAAGETYHALSHRNLKGAGAGWRILRTIDAPGDPINPLPAAP